MDYKYKFSIITAVYNVELYLAECIESIIEQDIGIENTQLILVDDGSPDGSGAICDEYAAKYPDNIFVIHKENGGVSSARNTGLEIAEGKYINFIDSDDKYPPNVLSSVWKFFEKHYNETDIVAIPLMFFDGRKGQHMLNYRFAEGSRVINLKEVWNLPQLSITSTFCKAEAFNNIRFSSDLAYAEDAQVAQKILLNNPKLGLLKECHYLYRKRISGPSSALQDSGKKPNWYLPVLNNFHKAIINLALSSYGYVPKFIQMTLMYDLQWRIKREDLPWDVLPKQEVEEYLNIIKEILQYIDDDVILAQRNIFREHKLFVLKLKYSKEPDYDITNQDIICKFSEKTAFKLSGCHVTLQLLDIANNCLKLEGFVTLYTLPYKNVEIFAKFNGDKIPCNPVEKNRSKICLEKEILSYYGFSLDVPLKDGINDLQIGANINGKDVIFNNFSFANHFPVNNSIGHSYCLKENWIVNTNRNKIFISPSTLKRRLAREVKFLLGILRKNPYKGMLAVFTRFYIRLYKLFKQKPLWLISDRASVAGDNGEALFRYIREKHREIDARFVICDFCEDYTRIKKIGPVLKKDSNKHKVLALASDAIISSHAENEIYNPWRGKVEPFRDIWSKRKFVFLQHGVIKDDISSWLNKYNKNFSGFVTSAKREYDSVLECAYNYTEKEVWLTGLPRFDRLVDNADKRITIMPTWRKYLTKARDAENDIWLLVDDFKERSFFEFYNGLINSEKLLAAAEKYGYKIDFFPHPTLQPHIDIFDKNDKVSFLKSDTAYKDIYAKSSLILTDFSSAVFDFAYLRKPVIYSHFDNNEIFEGNHIGEIGYFDYEKDGFGEVEYDLESTIDRIIEYMENGCKLKDVYRERTDNFFAFNDKNNCQRVYEKILEITNKE